MSLMSAHNSSNSTKLIYIGESGSGKTGSLCSLANAGYNLRILDTDNGADIVKNVILDPSSKYKPECIDLIRIETITETMKVMGSKIMQQGKAWGRCVEMLANWTDTKDGTKLGPITSWGPQDILVIDSLTHISNFAMNFILSLNGRAGGPRQQQDWLQAQDMVESLLQMLYDVEVKCNVIVCCHITYIESDSTTGAKQTKAYPNSLGKALPPKIGTYFNNALMVETTGSGSMTKKKILTKTTGIINLKNSKPLSVPPEFPLETGLADYFAAIRK